MLVKCIKIAIIACTLFLITTNNALSDTPESQPEIGALAIVLDIDFKGCNDSALQKNLSDCLKYHLEFCFWRAGWKFDFVSSEKQAESGSFELIAVISGKINVRLKKSSEFKKKNSWPFSDIKLKSSLEIEITSLKNKSRQAIYSFGPLSMTNNNVRLYTDSKEESRWLPELPNFLFMRQLSVLLDNLPVNDRQIPVGKKTISINLYLDHNDPMIDMAVEYASWSFGRQFGYSYKIENRSITNLPPMDMDELNMVFDSLRKRAGYDKYGLDLYFITPNKIDPVFISPKRIQVGLANPGSRAAIITKIQLPGKDYTYFNAFQIGQLILHELSHLLGAVDVADDNSIMCAYTNWISSNKFDKLNNEILSGVLESKGGPGPLRKYLARVASAMEKSRYRLMDMPNFFFIYSNINRPGVLSEAFMVERFGRAIPYAINGFQDYMIKDYPGARDNFYRCLALIGDHGSIHHYLSLVTSGALSEYHRKKAASLGYYPARIEFGDSYR